MCAGSFVGDCQLMSPFTLHCTLDMFWPFIGRQTASSFWNDAIFLEQLSGQFFVLFHLALLFDHEKLFLGLHLAQDSHLVFLARGALLGRVNAED
jgi:hypothetical protein